MYLMVLGNRWTFFMALLITCCMACNTSKTDTKSTETAGGEPQEQATVHNVSPEKFKELMKQPNTTVIDVRTFQETSKGKIEGAMDIDIRQEGFEDKIKLLPKDRTYLVYCRSGRRSTAACEIMLKNGFTKLYNMEGGWNAYRGQH